VEDETMSVDVPALLHVAFENTYVLVLVLLFAASAGVPLPVGLLLAGLGAASADSDGPGFLMLAVCGLGASVAGDALDYWLGRLSAPWTALWVQGRLRRHPQIADLLHRVGSPRSQSLLIFASRFALTPLAVPVSLAAGASRLAFWRFFRWDLAGEALFVVGNLAIGRVLSRDGLIGWPVVLACGATLALGWLSTQLVRRRLLPRLAPGGADSAVVRDGAEPSAGATFLAVAPKPEVALPGMRRRDLA
jgi:membrane protein DedA with SNARE-associated domain